MAGCDTSAVNDFEKVPKRRRRILEAIIRIIDLIVYVAVFTGGLYAIAATPASVVDELEGSEWMIPLWGALLLVGGLGGFLGRLTRYWFLEVPSTTLAFSGILIYFVVLGRFAFTSITAVVATTLVLVAMAAMVHRWAELQIFASEPGEDDFRSRVARIFRRRTQNYVHRAN